MQDLPGPRRVLIRQLKAAREQPHSRIQAQDKTRRIPAQDAHHSKQHQLHVSKFLQPGQNLSLTARLRHKVSDLV